MTMTATEWERLNELLAKCEENQGISLNEAEELDILVTRAELEEDDNAQRQYQKEFLFPSLWKD